MKTLRTFVLIVPLACSVVPAHARQAADGAQVAADPGLDAELAQAAADFAATDAAAEPMASPAPEAEIAALSGDAAEPAAAGTPQPIVVTAAPRPAKMSLLQKAAAAAAAMAAGFAAFKAVQALTTSAGAAEAPLP